jgi:hypothetical protein
MTADGDTALPLLGRRGSKARQAVQKAVREVPTALLIIVAIGVCLRVALSIAYWPAAMNFVDTGTYVYMADGHMFYDLVRPAGYSYFLKAVHAVSSEVAVTIAVQHLLGIIAGGSHLVEPRSGPVRAHAHGGTPFHSADRAHALRRRAIAR